MTKEQVLLRLTSEFEKMPVPAENNRAVARCTRASLMVYCEARLQGDSVAAARAKAGAAFRLAMPGLIGDSNVRDFIACTTHGMLLELIKTEEVTKLLYAAQVAHSTRRARNQARNDAKKPASPPQTTVSEAQLSK